MPQPRRQRKKLLIEQRQVFEPLNDEQSNYVDAIKENSIVICIGPAGVGKSCVSAAMAAEALNEGSVDRIVIARSSTQSDLIGFLPGSEIEKIEPALNAILAELSEFLNVKKEIEDGRIEITSLAFLRGRSFKNSFIILEEGQNCTYAQLKMFITRIGRNSTMVISGDISQSDLLGQQTKDFPKFVNQISRIATPENKIEIVELTKSVRHEIIDKLLEVLD